MRYYYCKSWFRAKKIAIDVWSEEVAGLAHKKGEPYTVLVESQSAPTAFIEVTRRVIVVGHLDSRLREKLTYSFQACEDESTFLSMAVYRDFAKEDDTVVSGTSYTFSRNGSVSIEEQVLATGSVQTTNKYTDVTGNYENFPSFGHYDGLVKIERS